MESFNIGAEELSTLFTQEEIRTGKSLTKLNSMNGVPGLCDLLRTSAKTGIDPSSISAREFRFGNNKAHAYRGKPIWHFIWVNLGDRVLQILIVGALISLTIGILQEPSKGWLEGTAILVAVVIVVIVSSLNDYMKEKQFIKLNLETDTHTVIATRNAQQVEISAYEIVVGDLIFIGPGELLPVDGILVQGNGLKVDESSITGESSLVKKDALRAGDLDVNPFVISGSKISDGSGHIICCNVGKYSVVGKNRMMTDTLEDDLATPLQGRLVVIAGMFAKLGFALGALLALLLITYTSIDAMSEDQWDEEHGEEIVDAILIGITILVVAIPEGLPLALTLSMAYSILRMKKENIFVRHLKGCEIMGASTNILSDKTGTLTQNKMTTAKIMLCGKEVGVTGHLSEHEKCLVAETIARNSTAFLSEDNDGSFSMIGNKTELALLAMIQQWDMGYEHFRNEDFVVTQFAFSSSSKRMTTVYDLGEDNLAIYCKGAGEIILDKCTYKLISSTKQELTEQDRDEFTAQFREMASNCLRIIGVAYKYTHTQDLADSSQEEIEKDLIFLGFIGIKDPLRPESAKSVLKCQDAGVKVRILTGDSIETAVKIAQESNILPVDLSDLDLSDYVIEGTDLRERSGGLQVNYDVNGKIESFEVRNQYAFDSIMRNLAVIARCTPEDKLLLVVGLKKSGEVVGVTGDGSNDAAALKQSDIGLAMMSGTALAKESSDIILLDDNFESVVNSIKWGRNVYASIRKFLQFQITVNIVALIVSIVGAMTVRDSPLTAVQMLWVNLIMDSVGALALATEPPTDELFKTLPFGRTEGIITKDMYISIISQAIYQVFTLLTMIYLGPTILDIPEGWGNDEWNEENGLHFTLIFHGFVMMQMFNEISCRKLSMNEWNLFSRFFNNPLFISILGITFLLQLLLVELGGEAVKCSGLSFGYHILCIGFGVFGLILSLIVRIVVCTIRKEEQEILDEEKKLIN